MAKGVPDSVLDTDAVSIKTVSALLGVPLPTLRSWERRYGVPQPRRTSGGHRRYSRTEVYQLRRMRDEIAIGRRPRDAAAAAMRVGETQDAPVRHLVVALLERAAALDPVGMLVVLDQAARVEGLGQALSTIVLPALRDVGYQWQLGVCDEAEEHLATDTIRGWLARLAGQAPPPRSGSVVLACGPRDLHTVAMEAFAVLLGERGWAPRLLGAQVPAAALVNAAVRTGASDVVVVSELPTARRAAVESLTAVSRLTRVRLWYAGRSFSTSTTRRGVPGQHLGDDLVLAADRITGTPSAPR